MSKRLFSLVLCALLLSGQVDASLPPGAVESISYLYNGSSAIYSNIIGRTRGNLTVVLPDYFHIDEKGDAVLTRTPDPAFIAAQQKEGRKVVAYVSNHWNQGSARLMLQKRGAVAAKLAAWAEQYGLDGIDIDIENLNQNDRADFTDFIRLMREALPSEKRLSAAVAPNPYGLGTGWQGQYDYATIGAYCDTVLLMTYDQSYNGGPPGPVASYPFIEQSIREALKYIPANKLLMGIPLYGRYWTSGTAQPVSGLAFTIADIDVLTQYYPSVVWYDTANDCARATVTVSGAAPPASLWGGKQLSAGKYDIWYENERSLSKKLSLVRKYGLRGAGSWALGQEPERIWTGYRSWLSGLPFSDIEGHWSEEHIYNMYHAGLVSGDGYGRFTPERKTTRAEMCVMLCKLLDISPVSAPASAPEEIRAHWAAGYLWAAISTGLIAGDERGYRPGDSITRQELAALAAKALNLPDTIDYGQAFYTDVNPSMWSNNAIVTLSVYGLMNGMGGGRFYPHRTATRAEAAVIVWKMTGLPKNNFSARMRTIPKIPLEPR